VLLVDLIFAFRPPASETGGIVTVASVGIESDSVWFVAQIVNAERAKVLDQIVHRLLLALLGHAVRAIVSDVPPWKIIREPIVAIIAGKSREVICVNRIRIILIRICIEISFETVVCAVKPDLATIIGPLLPALRPVAILVSGTNRTNPCTCAQFVRNRRFGTMTFGTTRGTSLFAISARIYVHESKGCIQFLPACGAKIQPLTGWACHCSCPSRSRRRAWPGRLSRCSSGSGTGSRSASGTGG
jgi:hypothetical protein